MKQNLDVDQKEGEWMLVRKRNQKPTDVLYVPLTLEKGKLRSRNVVIFPKL